MSAALLKAELAARAAEGQFPRKVGEIAKALAAIGYRMDRRDDCRSLSRYMTGPRAGVSYPCTSTGMQEIDTGLRAYHRDARRDARFAQLQAMRTSGEYFAVVRGSILEI